MTSKKNKKNYSQMNFDQVLFGEKKFSNILEEIYENSKDKEKKISKLINDLSPLILNVGDATMMVPLIAEYLEISVKNDEQLVKMVGIVQRMMASITNADVSQNKEKTSPYNEDEPLLSEKDKMELMADISDLTKQ